MASGVGKGTIATGYEELGNPEKHCVLAFPRPGQPNQHFVVDMSRMQYGEAGRGDYGENYFLGTLERWTESMTNICEAVKGKRLIKVATEGCGSEERFETCVKNVWETWDNREMQGWCDYCGKPDKEGLMAHCVNCGKVQYCCNEHLKAARKLHKHMCWEYEADDRELKMEKLDVRGLLNDSKMLKAVWVPRRSSHLSD